MSNNRGNNRRRGRGNNRQPGGGQQVNRIDSRARGNAPQLLEKYRKLAHDAHLNGDRVLEEYYLQFADHYFRVIADTRQRQEDSRQRRDDRWQDGTDPYRDEGDGDYGSDPYGAPSGGSSGYAPEPDEGPRYREAEPAAPPGASTDAGNDGNAAASAEPEPSVYEPPENPFVRENRGSRGLKPRRPRRDQREGEAGDAGDAGEGGPDVGLDPASLPPSISAARDEAPATAEAADAGPAPEAKPRRRTRRKPAADEGGEPLQSVG